MYEINPIYKDASLKGQLIGHENLITTFTLIEDTPMLVSADDKGKLKVWDFRNFTCIQTIDFSDKTVITNLLDMIGIGKLGIFGSRVNYIEFESKFTILKKMKQKETQVIEWLDFDETEMQMLIFCRKTVRIMDLHTGTMIRMFNF